MTCTSDEYTELKSMQATTEKQDSVPTEDPTMKQEISFITEPDSPAKAKEEQGNHGYDNIQSTDIAKHLQLKGIGHLSMTV
ncbi:hypothetical protein LEMLEM_LOCUS15314, partial [Lemmus lemmus]